MVIEKNGMEYEKPAVLVVDDHALILQGIKSVVEGMSEIGEVCLASAGVQAIRLMKNKFFHVIILDIELPDVSGFELMEIIRHMSPETRIVINTMHEETWLVKKMIRMGADGITLKSANIDEIRLALKCVLRGEKYFCDEFNTIKKMLRLSGDTNDYQSMLTKREMEILKAISTGMQTKEIAESLHVSVNTVESHRKSLFSKFEVKNVVQLVVKAIDNGIVHLKSRNKF